jgi:hypothetical protein
MSKNEVQARLTSWFERDRTYLVALFEDIRDRSKIRTNAPHFGELGVLSLIQEMKHLELCSRFGLPEAFVHFDHSRTERTIRTVEYVYATNDPDAGGEATFCVHREHGPAGAKKLLWSLHAWEVRQGAATIEKICDRWIRKLRRIDAPQTYPALPLVPSHEAPEDLSRDPLWRKLHAVCDELTRPQALLDVAWSVGTRVPWVHSLNALVVYELRREAGIFGVRTDVGGRQAACCVAHPGKGAPLELPFLEQGRLDAASLDKMRTRLLMWLELRRKQLVEIYGRARTAKTDRTGRPPTDPKRDVRIWEMRNERKLSIAQIANDLDMKPKQVQLAIDRERKRRKR